MEDLDAEEEFKEEDEMQDVDILKDTLLASVRPTGAESISNLRREKRFIQHMEVDKISLYSFISPFIIFNIIMIIYIPYFFFFLSKNEIISFV